MANSNSLPSFLRLVRLLMILAVSAAHPLADVPSGSICLTINATIPGRVSFPGQAPFQNSGSSYYVAQEREIVPNCVFRPTDTSEVSQFIRLISAARQNGGTAGPQFAVRTGGHMLIGGAANIQGGVTVDMRAINSFALNQNNTIASFGGGTIYSDIYAQLDLHNVTVPGARATGIGSGGFSSGGGANFLGRRHGWSCDNVYGYEVVLANGSAVEVTEASYPDLWLALKGGSSNFGIITRYDMMTYPQGQMWGGVVAYNYTQSVLTAQTRAFSNFMSPHNFDDAADLVIILDYTGNTFVLEGGFFYLEPTPFPETFEPFTSIPSLPGNSLGLYSISDMVLSFGGDLPSAVPRCFELVYSFKNVLPTTYLTLIRLWETRVKSMAHVQGLGVQFLIQPQPVTQGKNSLGLEPQQKDVVLGLITATYTNAADDWLVKETIQRIISEHESILRLTGSLLSFKYLNYADISQDPFGSYGKNMKASLQAASKKYDPQGLFQTGMPGGFKLF